MREPLLAKRLFEFIHVDITEIFPEQGKLKVAFIKYNFSRAVWNRVILYQLAAQCLRQWPFVSTPDHWLPSCSYSTPLMYQVVRVGVVLVKRKSINFQPLDLQLITNFRMDLWRY
jgi:hypothetical protein